mmetsp:Transcript_8012/g.22099  ORF Transcript_8012/g.22099 Transcript_8012/m.22099 type:complete len:85 (+) Transcript_8012:1291-1545(+)
MCTLTGLRGHRRDPGRTTTFDWLSTVSTGQMVRSQCPNCEEAQVLGDWRVDGVAGAASLNTLCVRNVASRVSSGLEAIEGWRAE